MRSELKLSDIENTFVKWIINAIGILVAIHLVPGIDYSGSWWGMFAVVAIFVMVNSFIRPFIKLFTFPLLIVTFGLFSFIINAMMLSITSWFAEKFSLGFSVEGFKASLLGALLISIVSLTISCLLPPGPNRANEQHG